MALHAELVDTMGIARPLPSIDDGPCEGIDDALAVLAKHTDDQWPLRDQLRGWRNALVVVESHIEDQAMRQDVHGLIDTIGDYLVERCGSEALGDCELAEPTWGAEHKD